MDEAEQYATDKLVEVLDTKRNIKLRMILSNHYPTQFPPKIMKSVQSQTKTKIAFYVEDDTERRDVARQLYGGKLKEDDVEYALRQQQKRQAVMKLGKRGSVIAKTHEVADIKPDKQFLQELLATNNYATIDEILNDYEERLPANTDSQGTESRTASNRKTTGKTAVPGGVSSRAKSAKKPAISEGNKKSPNDGEERAIKI